ncbi:MAG TPA: undecaprenyl diphosphate synthase family protein [Roseiarcus sp.]|nr:undecaprenyl diphosphate synthase family protein [Roseiarcus sp.]
MRKIRRQPSPRHVGIILDGNRRHGRSLGLTDPQAIYRLGAQKLDDMLDWCAELAIPTVTLWVFSTDNFALPPKHSPGRPRKFARPR